MESRLHRLENEHLDQVAIGVIATEDNIDAIVRITVRAEANGHSVIVVQNADLSGESLQVENEHGLWISPPEESQTDEETLRQLLTTTARAYGFPGLLVHDQPDKLIDYDQINGAPGSEYTADVPLRDSPREEGAALVAIPAYNEENTIGEIVAATVQVADEVLVIDDGSDDETAVEARRAGAIVIEHGTNRGYGAALKTAFEEACRRNADSLVVIDGDGQHDSADIPRLRAEIDDGADVVIGSRFADGAETDLPLYRWIGVTVINVLTNLSMGVLRPRSWVHDTQCGFRAYGPRAIESLARDEDVGDGMDASTDILYHAHAHGYTIREIGTTVDYDVENASTRNPVSHGLTLVKNILRTVEMERPVTAFGLPGVAVTFVGLGLGYWTLSDFLSTGTISLGLTLIAVFCILAGFLATVTAVILHALSVYFRDLTRGQLRR